MKNLKGTNKILKDKLFIHGKAMHNRNVAAMKKLKKRRGKLTLSIHKYVKIRYEFYRRCVTD